MHFTFGLIVAYLNGVGPVGRLHRWLNRKPGEQRFSRQVQSKKTNGTAFAERVDNDSISSYTKGQRHRWPFAFAILVREQQIPCNVNEQLLV
jgi:hypothetical protein